MPDNTLLLWAGAGVAAGVLATALVAWLILRQRLAVATTRAHAEGERRHELEGELGASRKEAAEMSRQLAVAEERVNQAQKQIEEQKKFLVEAQKQLEDSFGNLAKKALAGNSEQFLTLAKERFTTSETEAKNELEKRKKEIENLLKPLAETLGKLDQKTGEIEKARVDAYARIGEQVKALAASAAALDERTQILSTALRGSQVRGRWGEIALRNLVELAGMSEHCDFEEQKNISDGKRPDMTIHLPGERRIPVDAKAPLTAYLEANEAPNDAAKKAALAKHARALREHVKTLAGRDYAAGESEIDLVVMFLPGDPFLGAAFASDPNLQIDALRQKVLIATPTTLVALLRTVAIYWQQRDMAVHAEEIFEKARELYERAAKFSEELAGIGKGLKSALDAYNRAVGSFDRRLMPAGKRLEELRVSEQSRRSLEAPEQLEEQPRDVSD